MKKVIIIDLDAHCKNNKISNEYGSYFKFFLSIILEGNGYGKDFIGDDRVVVVDFYNHHIYPFDKEAKLGISIDVDVDYYTDWDAYKGHLSGVENYI